MMAAEARRHEGHRPYSAGDGMRRHPLSVEPPPPPFRRDSSLERGIIGAPPPLVRASDHLFTAAEVEALLAVRENELLSVRRRLFRASKKNDALESRVAVLKAEGSELRRTVEEGAAKQDELQLRLSELEDVVKRKSAALKTSNNRRERAEETAKAETEQAQVAAELARNTLEDARRKEFLLKERAQDAEILVKSLQRRLEVSEARAAETKRVGAAELAGRVSAHQQDRVALEAAVSAGEEESRGLREKLEEALEGLWQKQEAEHQTDKVVRELQTWRERVASGDVVEMSSSEAKRLRWSEEQAELMKEANANLRSQLLESGKLLAEAEHSFQTVTAGFGDATGTIAGLSARLEQKTKDLLEAERGLQMSKADASRLKKCVTSLRIGLSEEQRRVRGRERALDSTRRAMEALVRARQEEVEAKYREAEKRRAAERVSSNTASEKESLRLRAEAAEECSREMDAERRVLIQHVAAAREEAALLRWKRREDLSPSKARASPGPPPTPSTSSAVLRISTNESSRSGNPVRWRETIRSLLERAVSDWSVKSLLRPVSTPTTGREDRPKEKSSGRSSAEESSSDSMAEENPGEAGSAKTPVGVETPGTRPVDHFVVATIGRDSARSRRKRLHPSRESNYLEDATDVPRPLKVVRVYGAPVKEGNNRSAGWRWDLALPVGAREDSHSTREILAALGLRKLGRSLRERGVRGEGARMALTAVARLLDALLLTRSLAAQQCAQVRTELALALARLSTRSSLVSNTRSAARQASTCNRTLLLRLVDLELRRWRDRAAAAAASGNREGMEPNLDSEDEDGNSAYQNTDHLNDAHETEGEGLDTGLEANEDAGSSAGERTPDLPPRTSTRLGEKQQSKRSLRVKGAVLNLSNVGVDDETLGQVVRKILRACTHGCDRQLDPPGDARVRHKGSSKASAVVPLGRLLLRGNNITDAGALALVPLLKESPHVTELDLRDNAIGKNGKMALKKALTCSPWVHRVVSEDVCGDPSEGEGVGGLVLRGKRRQRSTASDRARAYAFQRIPPSSFAPPSRLDGLSRSTRPKANEYEDTASAAYGRAPAYGGSAERLSPGKDGTGDKCGEKKGLSLMHPLALLESPTSAPFTFVAPSCVVDFRGCARRPFVLPLVGSEGSAPRDPSPTLSEGKSKSLRHGRRRGRRHRGSPGVSTTPGRLEAGKTEGCAVHFAPERAPSRRLRLTRGLKSTDRDDDCQHPPTSEDQDEDGLAALLNVSRRIFSKTEGFEQTPKPGEVVCTSRATARTHKQGCIGPAEGQLVDSAKPSESRRPALSKTPNAPSLSSPSVDRERSPCPRPRRGIRWRRAPRPHNRSSVAGGRTEAAATAAKVVEDSSGFSSPHSAYSDKEEPKEGAHPDGKLEPSLGQTALEEEPIIQSAPPIVAGPRALEIRDKEQRETVMNGGLVHDSCTSVQVSEGGDATLQPACASTPLPPAAREISAAVVEATTWDEAHQSSDNNGWAYDEATSSWYAADTGAAAAASVDMGDGQTYADQGWRYDEQSATWHQDESGWQAHHDQHEPLRIEACEHAAVTTEVLEDQGAPGDGYVEHVGLPDDGRVGASEEMLLDQDIEREDEGADEAGGLLAKRIKALELALTPKQKR